MKIQRDNNRCTARIFADTALSLLFDIELENEEAENSHRAEENTQQSDVWPPECLQS